jgi:hypothetical protein
MIEAHEDVLLSFYLHFTAEGYRIPGKQYAERMLSILGYKITEP